MPASGSPTHRHGLVPVESAPPRYTRPPPTRLITKVCSAADVIVTRYPVCPLTTIDAAAVLAAFHVMAVDTCR